MKTQITYVATDSSRRITNRRLAHVGHLSAESARKLADRHAARRGLTVKEITVLKF